MNPIGERERGFVVDLENGLGLSAEDSSKEPIPGANIPSKSSLAKVHYVYVDGTIKDEEGCGNVVNSNEVYAEHAKIEGEKTDVLAKKKVVKEESKRASNKKALKPPRPPRGPSLDAADQKLIKEIAEVALLKRSRIERMKALKKMKATKPPSNSNIFAMLFTVVFCLVIIFQGTSSRVTSVNLQGSPVSAKTTEGGLISVQYLGNQSGSDPNGAGSGSAIFVESLTGSNPLENLRKSTG